MRCLPFLFLIAVTIAACGSSDPVPPALTHYVAAQEALAADDLDQARQALQGLVQSASPTLKPLAEKAASAADIAAVRVAFKPLSEEVRKGQIPEGYVVAYCPMADGDKGSALGPEGPTPNRQSLLRRFHAPLRRLQGVAASAHDPRRIRYPPLRPFDRS